ncbi:MAG TPA: hypothetical protein VK866_09960 [Acidimicrobiales bacterium]|nr:hypothetical protein [Acidimicrobiales bacterium]
MPRVDQARAERALVLAVLDAFVAECDEAGGLDDDGALGAALEIRSGLALLDWDWEMGATAKLGDAVRRLAALRWQRRDDESPVWRWAEVLECTAAMCRLPPNAQRARQLAAAQVRAAQMGVAVPDED